MFSSFYSIKNTSKKTKIPDFNNNNNENININNINNNIKISLNDENAR